MNSVRYIGFFFLFLISMLGSLPTEVKLGPISLSAVITMVLVLFFCITLLKVKLSYSKLIYILPIWLFIFFDSLGFIWGPVNIGVVQNWVVWFGGGVIFLSFISIKNHSVYLPAFFRGIKLSAIPYFLFMITLVIFNKDDPATIQLSILFFSYFLARVLVFKEKVSLILLFSIFMFPIFTSSRIVLISEVLAGAYAFIFIRKYCENTHASVLSKALPYLGACILSIFVLLALNSSESMREANTGGDNALQVGEMNISTAGRAYWWKKSFESALAKPILGHGTDGSKEMLSSARWSHPHNDYLRIFHHLGVLGLIFWFSFVFLLFKTFKKAIKATNNDNERCVYIWSLLSLLFMSMVMLTDNTITYSYILFPCMALFGFTISLFLASTQKFKI